MLVDYRLRFLRRAKAFFFKIYQAEQPDQLSSFALDSLYGCHYTLAAPQGASNPISLKIKQIAASNQQFSQSRPKQRIATHCRLLGGLGDLG
ncbi:MAG: hypothetical protein LAO76_21645 [Acidobacteriia bacterium]|nr:hypothetical protein [Terriglobia bacterium]